ncbi:MAG TPA: ABC transporter permease, partial [Planctomycetota bacterium]|nr:ABC transporter permease [Planctomycetota bacterium]
VSLGIPPGSTVDLGRPVTVTGTVASGGEEDEELIVGLGLAQELSGTPGRVSRVLVSAVVRPETDEFRRFLKHPRAFTPAEQERMQCTNFPTNVARVYGAALGAEARVIHKVAETEGAVLRRIETVVWALAAGAVLAGCLSVLASMTTVVVDRRKEIGLLKALGATDGQVAMLFLAEALLVGLAGSLAGYAIGLGAAKSISRALFDDPVAGSLGVYLATLGTSLAIVGLGVAGPLRRVVSIRPQVVLHEA